MKEGVMRVVFCLAACACVLAVALICAFLFANGLPFFGKMNALDFLLGEKWKPTNDIYGILPMILGSLYITAGAVLFGAPIAVLTSVYMAYFAPKPVLRVLEPAVSLLAGMVLGIFAGVPLLGWLFRLAARLVQFALFAVGVMCFVLLTSSGKAVELPVVGKIHILD